MKSTDFVILGSGIAGLNTARMLAPFGKVLIVTKANINDAATSLAQGGIAAVTTKEDSFASHKEDTLKAGSYHNKKNAVDFLVHEGPYAIDQLVQIGVLFDRKPDGSFATSFEAAHSHPRVLHTTDFTGREIENALIDAVLENKNIEVWEHTFALDLLIDENTCFGIQVIRNNEIISIASQATILATGGTGQVYQWTTNPFVATGDGIAMAQRAGAKLTDLEFIQFHPTALKENASPLFLLSEALRGEGAVLVDKSGTRFIEHMHPQKELAPRDIVSRAIFEKQQESEVYLDMRHKGKAFLQTRFPNIFKELQKRGFDLAHDLIPVTPAAHFLCGGVVTDLQGRTSIKNLFAYGEVAVTGVHGANRLASNSLLEGMVFSGQIGKSVNKEKIRNGIGSFLHPSPFTLHPNNEMPLEEIRNDVKRIMWHYVGIERTPQGLLLGLQQLEKLYEKAETIKGLHEKIIETKNMIQTAQLITKAALKRKKSLGTHYIKVL